VQNPINIPTPFGASFVTKFRLGAASLLFVCSASPRFAFQAKSADAAPSPAQTQTPAGTTPAPTDSPKPGGGGGGGFGGNGGGGGGSGRRRGGGGGDAAGGGAPDKNAYDYHLIGPDGGDIPLSNYKGKYILVVNLGRKSAYNDQLPALIKLNDTYKDKGLVVIGIPSNEFGAAEPGTEPEILKAYSDSKVDFPVMGVSKIIGDDELPFYQYLTKGKGAPAGGNVAWNYTKFIIDNKGNVVARLDPDVAPESPEMLSTIDQILDGTYKPKKDAGGGRPGAGGGGGADPN
jgi:glutathione peroxidase